MQPPQSPPSLIQFLITAHVEKTVGFIITKTGFDPDYTRIKREADHLARGRKHYLGGENMSLATCNQARTVSRNRIGQHPNRRFGKIEGRSAGCGLFVHRSSRPNEIRNQCNMDSQTYVTARQGLA